MTPASAILQRFSLDGRTAVVTGAASGLGRAFALALADVQATAAQIGDRAMAVVADLATVEEVERAAQCVLEWRSGAVDVLINNAGLATVPGRLLDVPVEDWDRVMGANLRSVFLCTRALLPALLASGRGSIINMSSFLGVVGLYPGTAITAIPYAASKAAIIGFTRQLAIEYAAEGLRVNAIAPGWHGGTRLARERAATASTADMAQFEAFIKSSVPMGRRGTPDELVGLVLYLASGASAYLTGQVLAHDGGITAG
jgi:NAD(P)-dependent dehydrogenase (short-subunit alcohol dehydrogenase family)